MDQLIISCIFHIQVTDIPEPEVNLQAEERIPAEGKSKDDISVKLRDCEMLMDAKPIPNVGESCALILLKAMKSPCSHLGFKKDETFSSANRNSGGR